MTEAALLFIGDISREVLLLLFVYVCVCVCVCVCVFLSLFVCLFVCVCVFLSLAPTSFTPPHTHTTCGTVGFLGGVCDKSHK